MHSRVDREIRVGVIGVGGIAEVAHLPGYRSAGAEVAALCTANPDKVQSIAAEYGVNHVYGDYHAMLEREKLDAVSVCVPTYLHAETVVACLEAGKHVLCEKPPALNAEQAISMKRAAEANGKVLAYGLSARFGSEAQKLKYFAERGVLGEIYGAKVGWMRRRGNPAGWFTQKGKAGGGALIDLGVHGLDLAWWIMGKPKPVTASGMTYRKFGNYASDDADTPDPIMQRHLVQQEKQVFDVEDSGFAMIRFANGAHLMLEASWALNCSGERRYTTFYGTRGGAETGSGLRIFSELEGTLVDVQPHVPKGSSHQRQMRHFVAVLRGKEEPIAPAQDGVTLMKMIDAIYRSAELGREVAIDIPGEPAQATERRPG